VTPQHPAIAELTQAVERLDANAVAAAVEAIEHAGLEKEAAGALLEFAMDTERKAANVALLESARSRIRTAVRVAAVLGPPAVQPFLSTLSDADGHVVRELVARYLGEFGEATAEAVVPALGAALTDDELSVRVAAAEALAEMGPMALDAVPTLHDMMEDDAVWLNLNGRAMQRIAAAGAIWRIAQRSDVAVAAVKTVLSSGVNSNIIRLNAIGLAEQVGPAAESTAPLLVEAMKKPELATAARKALASVGSHGADD
jgi:HEAT repeat protein